MLGPITRVGHGKNLALFAWSLAGFLATFLLWSLLVGDWHSSTAGTDTAQRPFPPPSHEFQRPESWHGWPSLRNLIVFGDSYSENGFRVNGIHPTPDNPFGNHDHKLTFNPGIKWPEILHDNYSASSFMVYDFARTGALIEHYAYEARKQGVPPVTNAFREQVSTFEGNIYQDRFLGVEQFKSWTANSTLFAAWFGVNELLGALHKQLPIPYDPTFASYASSLDRLYRLGARNFLLLNMPPLHQILLTDSTVEPGDINLALETDNFNMRLALMHQKMLARHPDASWFLFDTNRLWTTALRTPEVFPISSDLRNTTGYCPDYVALGEDPEFSSDRCGAKLKEYFWLNSIHPNFPVQNLTAKVLRDDCWSRDEPEGYCSWKSTLEPNHVEEG